MHSLFFLSRCEIIEAAAYGVSEPLGKRKLRQSDRMTSEAAVTLDANSDENLFVRIRMKTNARVLTGMESGFSASILTKTGFSSEFACSVTVALFG